MKNRIKHYPLRWRRNANGTHQTKDNAFKVVRDGRTKPATFTLYWTELRCWGAEPRKRIGSKIPTLGVAKTVAEKFNRLPYETKRSDTHSKHF
jgi:hypothetical protein